MGIGDLRQYVSPYSFIPTFLSIPVSAFIAPSLGITDSNTINFITIGICVFIWIIFSILLFPIAEVEFIDAMNSLVLDRRHVLTRADDLKFNVKPSIKVKYMSKVLRILRINKSHFFLQFYWDPKKALQFKPNEDYCTLISLEGYPAICLENLEAEQVTNYSLKVSCTPQYLESGTIKICAMFITNPGGFGLDLLVALFFAIKSGEKTVVIKNKN